MAGMITNVRAINTKKGDQMAFVQLEDLQGSCEVVFFPKTYAEYKEKLTVDAVVIVKGKAQTRENQTTLLADLVQTYVESYVGIDVGERPPQEALPLAEIRAVDTAVVRPSSDRAIPDSLEEASSGWYDSEANPFLSEMPEWMQEAPPLVALPQTQAAAEPVASAAASRPEDRRCADSLAVPGDASGAARPRDGRSSAPWP